MSDTEKWDYHILRNQWAKRRILGDILPDHPIFGRMNRTEMVNVAFKVFYLPRMRELFDADNPLKRCLDAKSV